MSFVYFFLGGGTAMWFVLLLSVLTLVSALRFAQRPAEYRQRTVASFTWATSFAILSGVALNLAAVGVKAPEIAARSVDRALSTIVLGGIAESVAPAILGFTLLAFAWLLIAVGQRRQARFTNCE